MVWTRPEEPPIPTVWYTFEAKDAESDRLVTYRVEDLTEDRYDDVIKHYRENFVEDAPFCQNKRISCDDLAMAEIVVLCKWCFEQKMTLVCYKEGSDEIVGANLLYVETSDGKEEWKLQNAALRDIVATNEYMTQQFNLFEHYKVNHYLTAFGLAINRRYRGRGIATEVLKARVPLCRAFGIKLTATNFSADASQVAATKAGFESNFEVTYEDFSKMGPRYSFPGIQSKSLKLMSLKIE
ncbi:uncharacterized protein LOC129762485 [Toxorhynchites rutilus septentrionalis]|uniref:uncharacterized protein LOC129762485 n=1 Tax=Toxorhynchites rutilus septentrionalis TaxID=329112 RepID=UPI002479DC4F|nr:uncharacterized protein LOC129762485 [Toxorhynchites rutilus septentrionalis]XP_055616764.1 uncharacterized protein LOC129762485 [Toxorhynchites rutilus septentrionalis]